MIATVKGSRRKAKKAMHLRAFLNGQDISKRCFYADSRRGIARVYLLTDGGRPYVVDPRGRVATATWRGRVRLERV